MKKTAKLILSALIVFALVLSSCDMLFPPEEEEDTVDLFVESFTTVTNSSQEIIGVRILVRNSGNTKATASYSVYLSDTQLLVGAIKVYDGAVTVAKGGNEQIDVLWSAVKTWIGSNSVSVPTNEIGYYLGVKVDEEDAVDESNESNNELVSTERFDIDAIYADGTVTFEAVNATDYIGAKVLFAVMDDSDQDNEFFAMGTFTIDGSGNGSASAKNIDASYNILTTNWVGTGGENYNIGWLIDIDDDFTMEEGPSRGDMMPYSDDDGMFYISPLNGNEEVTANFNNIDFYPEGAIIGVLDGMTDAAGGEAAFFIVPDGTEIEGPEDITVLGIDTVDSSGDAFVILSDVVSPGFPNVSGDPFYPEIGTEYMRLAVIDMHGEGYTANGNIYNIPGDYVDAAFAGEDSPDPDTFTYEGSSEWIVKYSVVHEVYDGFTLIDGLILNLSNFSGYFGYEDIGFRLYSTDRTEDEGTTILSSSVDTGASKRVVYMGDNDGFPWSDSEGNYDLTVFIDTDKDGVLDVGEEALTYGIYFNGDGEQEIGVNGNDLEPWEDPFIDSEVGVYSETHEIQVLPDISSENMYLDDVATNDPPGVYEGTVFMVVNFFEDDTDNPSWIHFNFDPALEVDSAITHVNFHMNRSRDGEAVYLEYVIWDGYGNMAGANIYNYLAVDDDTEDNWEVFSIPLLGEGWVDRNNITSIGIGNPTDGSGYYSNSYDFDDIYFGTGLILQ